MKIILKIILLLLLSTSVSANNNLIQLNMVFVPASEKGDEKDYVNLINIIKKLTGYIINPIKVTDYNSAVESMRAGRADLAWFGGKTYIIASEIANAEAFAAGIRKGDKDATYKSYFIVRSESRYNSLSELKGKVLALNSIGSTSGDLIPRVELLKQGISEKSFAVINYAGSHDACMMSVLNRHADVCGMSSRNYDARLKDGTIKNDQIRIIHMSPPVPPPPLAYSRKLPENIRKKIKWAILEAHKHGTIGGYGGEMERYISVSDEDYNLLRDIDKLLNK